MEYSEVNKRLFSYISECTTPYQAVAHTSGLLRDSGFIPLLEGGHWTLQPGKKYYVTRNMSSLIAFQLPPAEPAGFLITAAHCDSPAFKIKENPELGGDAYVQLSTEKYGGMLCSSWMDRPLSVAGRVVVKTPSGVETRLVDFREPTAIIPNVAIHMNRTANESSSYNPAVDMLPLWGTESYKGKFRKELAGRAGIRPDDILSTDLFLYNPSPGLEWNSFISAPRLDDLQCAFASLDAFIHSENPRSIPVFCLFDNEEVGSTTKQGAASTFLRDVLERIAQDSNSGQSLFRRMTANSFLISCDNAHAVHPNHPEFADKNHSAYMNRGIVIKYNANQKYTSDGISSAIFRSICGKAGVPVQLYANRADMAGGSTLGNISNTQVSLNAVDIGLAQLAMHSAFETSGRNDTAYLIKALTVYFSSCIKAVNDGTYNLE